MITEDQSEKLQQWNQAKTNLAYFKDEEMTLRKECALFALKEYRPESFRETIEIGNGYKLKAENVLNYTLDSTERVEQVCEELTNAGMSEIASKVFKWKPTLSVSAYNDLSPEAKAIVDQVVSCSIGSPKLEIVAPKKKA